MSLGRHPLKLKVPAVHRRLIQAGGAEDRDPPAFVDRARPAQLARVRQQANDDSLLFPQARNLGVELIKARFKELGGAAAGAIEQLADLQKAEADLPVAADRLQPLRCALIIEAISGRRPIRGRVADLFEKQTP